MDEGDTGDYLEPFDHAERPTQSPTLQADDHKD
jgi:hypothetical protein